MEQKNHLDNVVQLQTSKPIDSASVCFWIDPEFEFLTGNSYF